MKSQFNNTQDLHMLKSLSNSSINGTQHQQSNKLTSAKPHKQGETIQSHREKKIKPSFAKKFIHKKTRNDENFSINNIDEHTPVQRSYREHENDGAQNMKSSLSTISPQESYSLSNSRFGNRKKSQQSAATNTNKSGQNSAAHQTPY